MVKRSGTVKSPSQEKTERAKLRNASNSETRIPNLHDRIGNKAIVEILRTRLGEANPPFDRRHGSRNFPHRPGAAAFDPPGIGRQLIRLQLKHRMGAKTSRSERQADSVASAVGLNSSHVVAKPTVPEPVTADGLESGLVLPQAALDGLGSGRPPDESTLSQVETLLGSRLGQVYLHSGAKAAHLADALDAKAFTAGRDIVYGSGYNQLDTRERRRLLAHELVHVAQQQSGGPSVLQRNGSSSGSSADVDPLEALILPGRRGFTDGVLDEAYRRYMDRGGEADPSVWAVQVTSGEPRERLEQLLGSNYAVGRRGAAGGGPTEMDVSRFERPSDYSPEQIQRDIASLRSRPDLLLSRLTRLVEFPIEGGQINIGHGYLLKGNIAEILAIPQQMQALEEIRRQHPDAELYMGVTARFIRADGTLSETVLFSDGVIASIRPAGLLMHRVFEIKSGRQGGAQATEQIHRWIEGHATFGLVLKLPGIGREFRYSDESRLVQQMTTATRHIITPTGTERLGEGSQHQVAGPVVRTAIPQTPEQIEYLTRLIVEEIARLQQVTRLADQARQNMLNPAKLQSHSDLYNPVVIRKVQAQNNGLALVGNRIYRLEVEGQSVRAEMLRTQPITVPMARSGGRQPPSGGRPALPPAVSSGGAGTGATPGQVLAAPTPGIGATGAQGPIRVPGPVPLGFAQQPNIINFGGRTIILGEGTTIPVTPNASTRGGYVIVGHSSAWWVANPATGRPIAGSMQGGEWYSYSHGKWQLEVDAAGNVRGARDPAYVFNRLPGQPTGIRLPGGGAGGGGGPRIGVRIGAGGLAILMVASEILSAMGPVMQVQRSNIAMRIARLDFYNRFGAAPKWEIRNQNDQEVQPWDVGADTGVFSQPQYHYITEIDVSSFKRTLPSMIGSYQDLVLFLDLGATVGAIQATPKLSPNMTAEQRAQPRSYTAWIDGGVGLRRGMTYDITETILNIEERTLEQLDKSMQESVSQLSARECGNVFRLKSGSETPLYRSAHGQRILSAQSLLGPNPWVRTVGRRVSGGAWTWFRRGHSSARVMVTPVNADAMRSALASAYMITQDIEDILEEVEEGGRPILTREPEEGVLQTFVAGPAEGETRFGDTRYYRHQQYPNRWTVAIGQLNEFWVDADQLESVSEASVTRYAASASSASGTDMQD